MFWVFLGKCKSTNLVENEDSSRDSDVIVDSSGEKSTDRYFIFLSWPRGGSSNRSGRKH